jgi:hypothetical protein
VTGENGREINLNWLNNSEEIIVDDFGHIYVADSLNNRIMRWYEEKRESKIIVDGNRKENELNQLDYSTDVSFDCATHHRIQRFDLISG